MPTKTSLYSTRVSLSSAVVILCAVGMLAGCDDGKPKRVPVSGTVLIDGMPLTTGTVRMYPASGGRPASGQIGPDGGFTITTFQPNDGAVVGNNKVEIQSVEALSDTKLKWHAPKKYATADTSGLTITIEKPTNDLELSITWDGGKPFIETVQ